MKIIVITDVHANLPALESVLKQAGTEGFDWLIHLGDAIAIGPYPRECLALMTSSDKCRFVMGNHEDWYANGLPHPRPEWMTDGELEHQYWTHDQLGDGYIKQVQNWPWAIHLQIDGFRLAFLHYALEPDGSSFKDFVFDPTPEDLDQLFGLSVDYVFYGHTHKVSDHLGRARYLNPGSLGCQKIAQAPYILVEIDSGTCEIQQRYVPYDDRELYRAFEDRAVPAREFIYKAFFGSRFPLLKNGFHAG